MSIHKPVLLKEAIELLNLKNGDIVVDATLGGGGHSTAILEKIGDSGKLVALDADSDAIKKFKIQSSKFKTKGKIFFINDNFTNLDKILADLKIERVGAVLADLGWSSDQLEGKGMSFQENETLDMRLDMGQLVDATKILNEYSEEKLGEIIREYGEEKYWKNIARKIVEYRKKRRIEMTFELVDIIRSAVPGSYRRGKINPATKTFQAIRIAVNNELENLKRFLPQAISALKKNGRLAVISFHSLEDRIVKNIFRENARGCICPKDFPQCVCGKKPTIRIVTKKPVTAGENELAENPRARSAKLRVCEKI